MAKAKNVTPLSKEEKEAKKAAEKARKEAARLAKLEAAKTELETTETFETITLFDCYNGLVTIESEDGKLFTVTQHRKGNAVTADSLDEANNEAAKYVSDTQY